MKFYLIPGILDFLSELRSLHIRTAVVTSSDQAKIQNLWRAHPELKRFFDIVITADDITRSKPDPEGYLLAAARLNAAPAQSVVFEDSRAGLQAARAGGMHVVGLATTLPRDEVAALADTVIENFSGVRAHTLFCE